MSCRHEPGDSYIVCRIYVTAQSLDSTHTENCQLSDKSPRLQIAQSPALAAVEKDAINYKLLLKLASTYPDGFSPFLQAVCSEHFYNVGRWSSTVAVWICIYCWTLSQQLFITQNNSSTLMVMNTEMTFLLKAWSSSAVGAGGSQVLY